MQRRSLMLAVGAIGLLGPTAGRATQMKFPDFAPPPADRLKTAGDGALSVGVYVMDDAAEQKTYFNIALKDSGITPLWISVANLSADRRFWFDVGQIGLSADYASLASGTDSVNDRTATGLAIADVVIGSVVLSLIAVSMLTDASNIKKNLIDRSLNSHTLGPGQSASGFVYLRRDKAHPGVDGCTLTLEAHEIPSAAGAAPINYNVRL